nr:hypothetical protein [uncultured Campylobacter sp.]
MRSQRDASRGAVSATAAGKIVHLGAAQTSFFYNSAARRIAIRPTLAVRHQ